MGDQRDLEAQFDNAMMDVYRRPATAECGYKADTLFAHATRA